MYKITKISIRTNTESAFFNRTSATAQLFAELLADGRAQTPVTTLSEDGLTETTSTIFRSPEDLAEFYNSIAPEDLSQISDYNLENGIIVTVATEQVP